MKNRNSPVFVTLGPEGTNHQMVTQEYLLFRELHTAEVILVNDFFDGLKLMSDGTADFMIQVAVHPDCADIVAAAHFEFDYHIVDTFISASKELGILTRKEVETPKTLGLQPATRNYANLDKWEELISVGSIVGVAAGLLEGRFDSGLTSLDLLEQHSDQLQLDVRIGTVDDPWIVIGKQRISEGNLTASQSSHFVDLLLEEIGKPGRT